MNELVSLSFLSTDTLNNNLIRSALLLLNYTGHKQWKKKKGVITIEMHTFAVVCIVIEWRVLCSLFC